jgi:hypothetical protein
MDALFGLDIFVNFLTPFEKYDKSYEYDHKKIAMNYIGSGALFIDIISAFPFQLIEAGGTARVENDVHSTATAKYLRLLRLQRLYRLLRLFRVVKVVKTRQFGGYLKQIADKFDVGVSTGRILKLFILSFFITHLFACFFYLCARMYDFRDNTWVS